MYMYPSAVVQSEAHKKDERKKRELERLRKRMEEKLSRGLGECILYQECKKWGIYECRKWTSNRYRAYLAKLPNNTWLLLAIKTHDYHDAKQKCIALVKRLLAERPHWMDLYSRPARGLGK